MQPGSDRLASRAAGRLVDELDAALAGRRAAPEWLAGRVLLDAGEDRATLWAADGTVSWAEGERGRPQTRICAAPAVLTDVLAGDRSGVEAFLHGDLAVTGNLALALQLEALFEQRPVGAARPERFPRPAMRPVGRVRTGYLEAGPRDGSPVVLLHGLGATNASMLPTIWDLSADHRVLAPDLPGHGASSAPRARYDAPFFSRWLGRFLDALGVERAVVVGNSLGGRIALEFALGSPDRLNGLVLLAPAVAFRRLRQWVPVVRLLRPELAALPLPMTQAAATAGLRALFAQPDRLTPQSYEAAAGEFVRVFRDRAHRIAFFHALRSIYLDDAFGERGFWRRLPLLAPPALFIWGRRDRLVPVGFARHVTSAVPGATTHILEDCGHVPQYELPDVTNRLIRQFLTGLDR